MLNSMKESVQRMRKFVDKYCAKSGTTTHPDKDVTEAELYTGLADHNVTLGRPRAHVDSILTKKQRSSIAPGFVLVMTCKFTSIAIACSSSMTKDFQ